MVVGTDQQEEGKDRDWWKGGEWKSWRELKKEGYSYRGAPQEDMGILFLSLASCPHSLHVSLGEEPIHDVVLGQSEQILPSVFHFPLYLSSLFLFAIERGSHFPRNSSFINQTSAACRGRGGGGGWMWRRRSDASDRQQMPRSVSYFLSSETSHRSETAERSLSMCQMKREKKNISETDDLTAPHDLLPVIHKASLLLSVSFFYLLNAAHRRSGYSGWCYSRCGVVEVSMLWPCYPGKRESFRGMPGEEETLYQKHILP